MLRRLLPLVLALAMAGAWAQVYPAKPVRIIVPFAPGGPDALARLLGAQLTQQMRQPFVVENKPGANGVIGAEFVAKSAPDGYTLMVTSSAFVTAPSMYKKLPYDTERDFAPVTEAPSADARCSHRGRGRHAQLPAPWRLVRHVRAGEHAA